MVNLNYVKRKKRNRAIAISGAVATGMVGVLILVAFLGRTVGSFTIKLKQNDVMLTLDEHSSFENASTYKWINNLPSLDVFTNNELKSHDLLDSEETDYTIANKVDKNGNAKALYFFKYTFFVKNVGTKVAAYDISLNITDNQKPSNVGYGLDDILRVRWYENDDDSHNFKTYAKKTKGAPHLLDDGTYSYEEYICDQVNSETNSFDYAKEFATESTILSEKVTSFEVGSIKRYTLVAWLEGSDPEAQGVTPKDCSIRLGVNIDAYEDQNE